MLRVGESYIVYTVNEGRQYVIMTGGACKKQPFGKTISFRSIIPNTSTFHKHFFDLFIACSV